MLNEKKINPQMGNGKIYSPAHGNNRFIGWISDPDWMVSV
jgi:hypothetical protein